MTGDRVAIPPRQSRTDFPTNSGRRLATLFRSDTGIF